MTSFVRWLPAVLVLGPLSLVAAAEEPLDFSGDKFAGKDFSAKHSGDELVGARFVGTDLPGAVFRGLNLSGASFKGANLKGAILDGADLTGADLTQAQLEDVTLTEANLSGANLEGQDLSKLRLGRVRARGANLKNLKAIGTTESVDFRGADLRGANLTGLLDNNLSKWRGAYYDVKTKLPSTFDPKAQRMVLVPLGKQPAPANETPPRPAPVPEKDFHGKEIREFEFGTDRELVGATFWRCDLVQVTFNGTNLSRCDFTEADLDNVTFQGADLSGAVFTNVRWRQCIFGDCKFAGTNFQNVNLQGVAKWTRPNFTGADLRGSSGIGRVENGDFSGADLRGADLRTLSEAGAKKAVFKGATYDDGTRWPRGVDPMLVGAVKAP